VFERAGDLVGESSVFIVYPQQIVGEVIVADVNVFPSIVIDICNTRLISISFSLYSGFFGDICKFGVLQRTIPVITI
jgi:hypothetical protein